MDSSSRVDVQGQIVAVDGRVTVARRLPEVELA
jgi:hypothetical protein